MASPDNPTSRKQDIVVQELGDEVLIYDLKENKAFCLNETSALVWQLCNGNRSVAEISESVGRKLNSPANQGLVWLALDQLKKENLLVNGVDIVPQFNGLSRREVIRKVGLGTMIALPLVSSLVAPTAAHAQSGRTNVACNVNPSVCGTGDEGDACTSAACTAALCPQGTLLTAAAFTCVNVGVGVSFGGATGNSQGFVCAGVCLAVSV